MADPEIQSPRIRRLVRRVASGEAGALEAFWHEVAADGAPIVEPIEGDAGHVLITFVFRGDASTQAVAMGSTITGFGFPRLARLGATDLWWRSASAPQGVRDEYSFLPDPLPGDIYDLSPEELQALQGRWVVDPLNPRSFQCGPLSPRHSVLELPGAEPQPWVAQRDGVPQGKVEPHRFDSEILGGPRVVWTYTPAGYSPDSSPYPLGVFYDGYAFVHMGAQHTLDNLIDAGRIPPMVCAFVQPADRMVDLACEETFALAMARDLVRGWLPERLHVTADPARTVIGGTSLGGLAAMFAGLRHPGVFGNVISQSGSFWWGPGAMHPADVSDLSVEWEWLMHQAAKPAAPALRCFIEVGVLESSPAGGRMPDMIEPNRRMRDALRAAGHDVVRYREFNGGHDYVCWRGTLADALIAIVGPWR